VLRKIRADVEPRRKADAVTLEVAAGIASGCEGFLRGVPLRDDVTVLAEAALGVGAEIVDAVYAGETTSRTNKARAA
jgi:hypothetical protein